MKFEDIKIGKEYTCQETKIIHRRGQSYPTDTIFEVIKKKRNPNDTTETKETLILSAIHTPHDQFEVTFILFEKYFQPIQKGV